MEVTLPPLPDTAEGRQPALEAALASIHASDPAFDQGVFIDRVKTEFYLVTTALSERNPTRLQAYLNPSLLASWVALAQRQQDEGVSTQFRGLTVDGVRLMWAAHGAAGDLITVGIDASAAVVGVKDATGGAVFGDGSISPLDEYWTWVRAAGGQTTVAVASACPNCGAPANPSSGALCHFCFAALPGPLQGWTLARVDEELQWNEEASSETPDYMNRERA